MLALARSPGALALAAGLLLGCAGDDGAPDDEGEDTGGVGAGAGVSGASGTASGAGGSAAGRGGAGGAGGSAAGRGGGGAQGGSSGGGRGGTSGTAGMGVAGRGASAGMGGAGTAGEPDPGACPNPLTTVDTTNLVTTELIEGYTVTGTTALEIRQSINLNRGRDYDAYTTTYISYQYATCNGGLVVTVDVDYSVPEWTPPANAEPALVAMWETYGDALFCHEFGHAEIGLEAGNDVYDTLSAIDTDGDCDSLATLADAAFQAIMDDVDAENLTYDAETNHGESMGAIFPPP